MLLSAILDQDLRLFFLVDMTIAYKRRIFPFNQDIKFL